jgi:hypothetical protein
MVDLPKLRSERRRGGEVSKLSPDALEEEPSQALATNCRYA